MIPAAEWDAAYRRQLTETDLEARRKLARWLRTDLDAVGGTFAVLPFMRIDTDDGPAVAAALLPPLIFYDDDAARSERERRFCLHMLAVFGVVASDDAAAANDQQMAEWVDAAKDELRQPALGPADRECKCAHDSDVLLVDRGTLHRDRGSRLILPPNAEFDTATTALRLYTDVLAWARDWAANRQAFVHRLIAAKRDYLLDLYEPADEHYPGALLIGDAARVSWPRGITFTCPDDATAKAVQRAIYRQADISRVSVAPAVRMAA